MGLYQQENLDTYGIPKGIFFSVPVVKENGSFKVYLDAKPSEALLTDIKKATASIVDATQKALDDHGLKCVIT